MVWHPSPSGLIKVNFERVICDDFVVGAAVLVDNKWEVISAVVYKLSTTDPLEDEVMAAELCIKEAMNWRFKEVIWLKGTHNYLLKS